MDRDPGQRAADRSVARPPDPLRPHPGDERRKLPSGAEQTTPACHQLSRGHAAIAANLVLDLSDSIRQGRDGRRAPVSLGRTHRRQARRLRRPAPRLRGLTPARRRECGSGAVDGAISIALGTVLQFHSGTAPPFSCAVDSCHIPEAPSEEATITLPQWWFEIITTFKGLYELPEAEYRIQKVLNELIGKQMERGALATYH